MYALAFLTHALSSRDWIVKCTNLANLVIIDTLSFASSMFFKKTYNRRYRKRNSENCKYGKKECA